MAWPPWLLKIDLDNQFSAEARRLFKSCITFGAYTSFDYSSVAIREIALLAGLVDQPLLKLGIAEVETTFDRLVYVLQGRPASSEGLPESPEFAATLLILREFMHHLKFSSITVVD